MNPNTVVLSNYPLSRGYRALLEQRVGSACEYLLVPDLRRLGVSGMIRRLRSRPLDAFILAYESDGAFSLRPALTLVGLIPRAKNRFEAGIGGQLLPIGRASGFGAAFALVTASIAGLFSARLAARELAHLERAPKVPETLADSRRVAYLNASSFFGAKAGGSLGHIAGVVNGLARDGWSVEYWHAVDGPLIDGEVSSRRMTLPSAMGFPSEANHYRVGRHLTRQLSPALAEATPSFIYQRLAIGNYSGAVLAHQLGIPLVTEYNGSEAWIARNWGTGLRYGALAERAEAVMLKRASLVVTVSAVLADELAERAGVERDRIIWYPNCIDERIFNSDRYSPEETGELRRQLAIPRDATLVGFIGTFAPWHGIEVLARSIAMGQKQGNRTNAGKPVHFILIGDGVLMADVRRIVSVEGDTPGVTLTGLVPQGDAPRYLAACDILVSPHVQNADGSRFFGSPTKLFEYMAMGRPIVASQVEQLADVLVAADDRNDASASAVLVPPADPASLWTAIERLVDDPELQRRIGANARADALRKFTWREHVGAVTGALARLNAAGRLFS